MDVDESIKVESTHNNNHNSSYLENNKIDEEVAKCSKNMLISQGDVNNIMKRVSDADTTDQSNYLFNYSPFPPRKISRRSKDSNRRSASSPRLKSSTPNSLVGTPCGSSSEREPNSSPASIDNPPTNGSLNTDTFGDGERSDKESVDSHSMNSTFHNHGGPSLNHHSHHAVSKRCVTIQMLLAAEILKPGEGTMSIDYHGQKFIGDLLENSKIKSQETSQEFSSPSAWAVACKQIINPDKHQRKSGCGWASIKYKGLKLDYYKTVWFKRLREGSIDIQNITNGTTSVTDESDDESAFCILKYGEHLDNSVMLSSQQSGSKIMITCSRFQEIDRLQPFFIKISSEALALADFHCNITSTESVGYISGRWDNEHSCLKMETVHPCKVIVPNSTSSDCDIERNRIAVEIRRLEHDVVGWYHSHPKVPPQPSKDDISRQLEFQISMKGTSEASYIPCVGVIISPLCYLNQENLRTSPIQFFWILPPAENRPMDLGRPMHLDYETFSSNTYDLQKLLMEMGSLINFYADKKDSGVLNDLSNGKYEKLQESISSLIPETRLNINFWDEVRQLFTAPVSVVSPECANSRGSPDVSMSSGSSTAIAISVPTPNSVVSNEPTPPVISTSFVDEVSPNACDLGAT